MSNGKDKLMKMLSQIAQDLGEEITVERLSQESIIKDGKFGKKRKASIEHNGVIKDIIEYERRLLSCGHISRGRENFGGICSSWKHDYRRLPVLDKSLDSRTPFAACSQCIKRCVRCKRLFCIYCITTVPSLPGVCFCKNCARFRRLGDFFLRR